MGLSSPTRKISPEQMIDSSTIAQLVQTAIELPNNAAIAENARERRVRGPILGATVPIRLTSPTRQGRFVRTHHLSP